MLELINNWCFLKQILYWNPFNLCWGNVLVMLGYIHGAVQGFVHWFSPFLSFSIGPRLYFPVLTLPPSSSDTSFISPTKTLIKLSLPDLASSWGDTYSTSWKHIHTAQSIKLTLENSIQLAQKLDYLNLAPVFTKKKKEHIHNLSGIQTVSKFFT